MSDRSKTRMSWIGAPSSRTAAFDGKIASRVYDALRAASDLTSPEFRAACAQGDPAEGLAMMASRLPSRMAAKVEWDEFDAWVDSYYYAAPLAAAQLNYAVEIVESEIGGVRVGVISPREGVAQANEGRILINLHGGGFLTSRGLITGQLESIPVSAVAGIKVVTLDYRQSPSFRYPAASEDVESVYRVLLEQYRPESIGIYGCSAGGILASQVVARLQSRNLPLPGAVGVFNMAPPPPYGQTPPWGAGWGDSGLWFSGSPRNVPTADEQLLWKAVFWYMEDADIKDVNAYPGISDAVLARFPPTLLLTGTRDFAASSVARAHARFLRLGVKSSLYVMEGALHGMHVTAVGTPEAHDAQVHVARWFEQHLAP